MKQHYECCNYITKNSKLYAKNLNIHLYMHIQFYKQKLLQMICLTKHIVF